MRFDPPTQGLQAGESIIWTRREGTGGKVIASGFLLFMFGPVGLAVLYNLYGMSMVVSGAFLLFVIFIVISTTFIRERRTRYYLTTERIIEARGGTLIKEMFLENFAGRPMSQFLEAKVTHQVNHRPIYTIRVYDPVSDEVFELKGLDSSSTHAFERIGQITECPYCRFDNIGISTECKNCGATL
ncbi:MAG: hypothetical protein AM325_014485 [Candidatus Thorarchaeota archaeon SMTZ1-45]|nr:MAG: hypothetical protein AM325_15950 [Candidatus Thorarchaeota archaeon SMTZ1-45]